MKIPTFQIIASVFIALLLATANPVIAQRGGKNAAWVGKNFWGAECKGFHNTTGTYDYLQRQQFKGALDLIEEHHFGPTVENLTKGLTTEPMGDIDFLLRSFPNHHRALYSAMTFRLRHRKWPSSSKGQPAECYYERAIAFSPNDLTLYTQYAVLQHKFRKYKEALESYRTANRLLPGNDLLQYNMALTMVELKQYRAAEDIAIDIYTRGFPLPGLKKKLRRAGHWKAADKETTAAAAMTKAQKGQSGAEGTPATQTSEQIAGAVAPDTTDTTDAAKKMAELTAEEKETLRAALIAQMRQKKSNPEGIPANSGPASEQAASAPQEVDAVVTEKAGQLTAEDKEARLAALIAQSKQKQSSPAKTAAANSIETSEPAVGEAEVQPDTPKELTPAEIGAIRAALTPADIEAIRAALIAKAPKKVKDKR